MECSFHTSYIYTQLVDLFQIHGHLTLHATGCENDGQAKLCVHRLEGLVVYRGKNMLWHVDILRNKERRVVVIAAVKRND